VDDRLAWSVTEVFCQYSVIVEGRTTPHLCTKRGSQQQKATSTSCTTTPPTGSTIITTEGGREEHKVCTKSSFGALQDRGLNNKEFFFSAYGSRETPIHLLRRPFTRPQLPPIPQDSKSSCTKAKILHIGSFPMAK